MENCKEVVIPIATNCYMSDEAGKQVDSTEYTGLIGYFLYLISRPNIQFSV